MGCFTRVILLGLVATAALPGRLPAAAQTAPCPAPMQPRQVAELLVGRDIGGRLGVGEAAFRRFVARELTPRFPDGLTVTDAAGQWRDPSTGATVREPAKRVEIVLAGAADDLARLAAAVDAYKREFHQRAVGVILRPACVSF